MSPVADGVLLVVTVVLGIAGPLALGAAWLVGVDGD